jgi:polyhydroxybutyrate depolymerase
MKSRNSRAMRRVALCLSGLSLIWLANVRQSWAQETKEKVTVDDTDRTFMVRLPKGYDASKKYPVVVLLHGLNQDPDDMERLTRFDEVADADGIIAVYPRALHGRWNVGVYPNVQRPMMSPGRRRGYGGGYPGGGYPGGGYPGGGYPNGGGQQNPNRQPDDEKKPAPADDVAFIGQMLDQMETKFSVDAARVYALGLSEGGFMSMRLACNLGDRFAAVGTVGATMPKTMTCLPPRPVPMVMVNGTSDPVVPYGGGTEHNLSLTTLSAEDSAKAWARIDRCGEKPEKSKLAEKSKGGMETKVDTYNGCHEDAQVALYSVKGAGNTWPSGEQYESENAIGKTSQDLDADRTIWSFLMTRKLPPGEEQKSGAEQK